MIICGANSGLTLNAGNFQLSSVGIKSCQTGIKIKTSLNTTILSTTFSNNFYAISLAVDSSGSQMKQRESVVIQKSTFLGNKYGLFIDGDSTDCYYCDLPVKVKVDQCVFIDSQVYINARQNYSLEFNSSMVSSVSGAAIELRRNCRSLIIFNSTFTRSQGSSCISLITGNLENLPPGQISIIRNTFKNNSLQNVIYVNEVTPSKIQLYDNTFENPTARYEVYQATPWKPGYLVDASRNWWGSSDPTVILSKIYDFYIGFPSAIVDISSVYKESEMLTLIDSSSWRDWAFDGLTTGGKFKQNLSIDLDIHGTSAIDVTSSIYVPRNIELKLIGSKVFNFVGSTGILVEGTQME